MLRRTKILATLGPATSSEESLRKLILSGVNAVRLNFSHGTAQEHQERADLIRYISKELNLPVAILGDLQGPKIRIAKFKNESIELQVGDLFNIDLSIDENEGDIHGVNLDYADLLKDISPNDFLLLDDGRTQLEVLSVSETKAECKVILGGKLSNNKGINKKGGGLSAPALTEKDKEDILIAAAIEVDYLAVSFPKSGNDMRQARELLLKAGGKAGLIAKIERAETVKDMKVLEDIILSSEGIMVARGDLGVEIGAAELVGAQKMMIQKARSLNRITITATQMMESMIDSQMPTRAEVMDVANSVLDGTDAVMLSGETAIGKHPYLVVEEMAKACIGAEKYLKTKISHVFKGNSLENTDISIASAAMNTANHLDGIKAIICLSESGNTPLLMSRVRSFLPIYALTPHFKTIQKVSLFRGVEPLRFSVEGIDSNDINEKISELLLSLGRFKKGDSIILTKGDRDRMGQVGKTNTMQIIEI